jgi:hypothetical protein
MRPDLSEQVRRVLHDVRMTAIFMQASIAMPNAGQALEGYANDIFRAVEKDDLHDLRQPFAELFGPTSRDEAIPTWFWSLGAKVYVPRWERD